MVPHANERRHLVGVAGEEFLEGEYLVGPLLLRHDCIRSVRRFRWPHQVCLRLPLSVFRRRPEKCQPRQCVGIVFRDPAVASLLSLC